MSSKDFPGQAYILHNQVTHVRFLPEPSRHAFVYPTSSLLISLKALEEGKLNLLGGRLFGYGSVWNRVTGLKASGYLHDKPNDTRSITSKLKDLLTQYGHDRDALEDAWLMTVPSFLGVQVINPLSVYFCYQRGDPMLWIVILEVHNTFGERHAYVLDTKSGIPSQGSSFHFEWTFPRQFHVSPFNDRSGFYRCQLIPPPRPPSVPSPSFPRPLIKVTLLTTLTKKKLIALQRTTHSVPLSTPSLLITLLRTPLCILSTFPKILYQACILHYFKRLDVFQRPEPYAAKEAIEVKLPAPFNSNSARGTVRVGVTRGGLGWQKKGILESWCERRVHMFLEQRCREVGISVELVPANSEESLFFPSNLSKENKFPREEQENSKEMVLRIYYRSPRMFTILFTTLSPQHALLYGIQGETLFSVSSKEYFLHVFAFGHDPDVATPPPANRTSILTQVSHYIRTRMTPAPLRPESQNSKPNLHQYMHILDSLTGTPLKSVLVLSLLFLLNVLEVKLLNLVGARFVRGDEPWGGWRRAFVVLERGKVWEGDGEVGSVRRER